MYRLDRTAFKAQTAEEACKADQIYYKNLTWQERLKIANYLNSVLIIIRKTILQKWINLNLQCGVENNGQHFQ